MTYGLYDGDLHLFKKIPIFNLELMKISSYYKNKREIVSLSPKFSPNLYTHFIVRQDFPSVLPYNNANNISYGGRAFDGGNYVPMELEIEERPPDITIYDRIKANKAYNGLNIMRRAEHVRLSLDGKTIWKDWEKQLRHNNNRFGIFFHDYDLGAIDGAYELIRDNLDEIIPHMIGRRIGMKFPVQVSSPNRLLDWYLIPSLNDYYYIQYNGLIPSNYYEQLSFSTKTLINSTQVNITSNVSYEEFISTYIIEVFKSIFNLRSHLLNFPLVYDSSFFADIRWKEVVDLINIFNTHIGDVVRKNKKYYFEHTAPYETFFTYMRYSTKHYMPLLKNYPKQKIQEIFQFVRENNYELFDLFYTYKGE